MKYLVLDTETTAIEPCEGDLIEIGIVEVDTLEQTIVPVLNCIINPQRAFNENAWIFAHSSLKPIHVKKQGILLDSIKDDLNILFEQNVVTAFVQSFDFNWLAKYGVQVRKITKDLQIASQEHFRPGYRLSVQRTLEFCKFDDIEPHRAIDDAYLEAKILLYLHAHGGMY